MAVLNIRNVKISGISACVPKSSVLNQNVYKWDGALQFIESTGIKERRVSTPDITASSLCIEAAESLIDQLGWDKNEIEALVFVSQTPDYILPASSCIIQNKLGLSSSCFTLDISLGCSGWVYALSVISSLMQNGTIKKGILLAGDTVSKICSPEDKSTFPLFGDAGSATALEYSTNESGFKFILNSDGKGFKSIIVEDGGFKNPTSISSLELNEFGEGQIRSNLQLALDGMDVFSFGITKAPKSIKELCKVYSLDLEGIDIVTFHQANMMMNEMIRKKLHLSENQVPYSLDYFGNTSCASIPLTLVTQEKPRLTSEKLSHIACGFGVGLSWGSVWFETDNIVVPDLIEI